MPGKAALMRDPVYRSIHDAVSRFKKQANKHEVGVGTSAPRMQRTTFSCSRVGVGVVFQLDMSELERAPVAVHAWLFVDFFRGLREPLVTYALFDAVRAPKGKKKYSCVVLCTHT